MIVKVLGLVLALLMSSEAIASEESKEQAEEEKSASSSSAAAPIAAQEAESVYMYSDAKPKSKCIFTLDLSKNMWEEGGDRRRFQIYDTVANILEAEKFISLPNWCAFGGKNTVSGCLGRFALGKLKTALIVDCQYHERSLSTHFEKLKWYVCTKVSRPLKKKWNIRPEETDPEISSSIDCMDLSWKWVDMSIHSMNERIDSYKEIERPLQAKFLKNLYNNIRHKGLENTLIRLSVVANRDSYYTFNVIYSNEKEEEKGINFLLNFKKKISRKFSFI